MLCWKSFDIPGYEVNNLGEIRSLDRLVIRKDTNSFVKVRGRLIKQQTDNCGYLRITLSYLGCKVRYKVHQLVAHVFIENPLDLPEVNHKDGVKSNNYADNLEWVTSSQNQLHAIATGLKVIQFAEKAIAFTGAVEVIDKQGNIVYTVCGNREMKQKGLDYRLVSAVLMGKRKSHRGFTYRKIKEV